MTDDHNAGPADEFATDDGIRRVMAALARSAPEAPPLPSAGVLPAVQVRAEPNRRRWLAVVAALALIGGGTAWAVVARRDAAQPVATEAVAVVHQRIAWTQESELWCEGGAGAGTISADIDLWVDVGGERARQRVVFADGTTRDQIWEGSLDLPTRKFERGSSPYVAPACPAWGPVAVDDTLGVMGRATAPDPAPEVGESSSRRSIVPGTHTDDRGRTAELEREEDDGIAQLDDGGESAGVPFRQTTEWYTEPGTGRLLQSTYRFEVEGVSRVTTTMVILSDEDATAPEPGLFDTTGYELVYEGPALDGRHVTAEPVDPTLVVGPDRYWPPEPIPGDAGASARRFVADVLGWEDPSVEPAPGPDPGGAWEVTVDDRRGHVLELTFFPIPSGGWELLRIDSSEIVGGQDPNGNEQLDLPFPVGTVELVIEGHLDPGGPRAWRAAIGESTAGVILPGTTDDPMKLLILLYRDADGHTIGAATVGGGRLRDPSTVTTEAVPSS